MILTAAIIFVHLDVVQSLATGEGEAEMGQQAGLVHSQKHHRQGTSPDAFLCCYAGRQLVQFGQLRVPHYR